MDANTLKFFEGFSAALKKEAAAPAVAKAVQATESVAPSLGGRIVGTLRRRPILAAAGAGAAGAGAATGVAEAKERQKELERKREQIRQLLMARLTQGGYIS